MADEKDDNLLKKVLHTKALDSKEIEKIEDSKEALKKPLENIKESKDTSNANATKKPKLSKKAKKTKAQENVLDTKKTQNKEAKKSKESKEIKESQKAEIGQIPPKQNKNEVIENVAIKSQDIEIDYESESAKMLDSTNEIEPHIKPQAKAQMPQTQNTQNKGGNILAQSLAIAETNANKNQKDSHKQDKMFKNNEIQDSQAKGTEEKVSFEDILANQNIEEEEPQNLEFLQTGEKKQKERIKESEEQKESKTQKNITQKQSAEVSQTKESTRSQILYRSAIARENIRHFAQTLREEIANYKPPVTKLSMELNPRNLGTLELTITKKGKDLHIQVVSNASAVGLFLQNQIDFKNNLAQVGFDNVDLSFGTNDNNGSGNQREQNDSQNSAPEEKGNKNSLEDSQSKEANVMNITIPKYV